MPGSDGRIHLILGGTRSGKSTRAEKLAAGSGRPVVYLATCRTEGLDREMQQRIRHHRTRRPPGWITLEDRYDLETVAEEFPERTVLIDCLTLWIAHEMNRGTTEEILHRLESGLEAMMAGGISTFVVSNEVGMGMVPMGPENRRYRDLVGWANQLVAGKAMQVDLMAAGLVMPLKESGRPCHPTE